MRINESTQQATRFGGAAGIDCRCVSPRDCSGTTLWCAITAQDVWGQAQVQQGDGSGHLGEAAHGVHGDDGWTEARWGRWLQPIHGTRHDDRERGATACAAASEI